MSLMTRVLLPAPAGIRLTKISVSRANSQEADGYTATLVVDGTAVAMAHNDGYGGSTFVRPLVSGADLRPVADRLQAWVVPLQSDPEFGSNYDADERGPDFGFLVDTLLERTTQAKTIKRTQTRFAKEGLTLVGYAETDDAFSSVGLNIVTDASITAMCQREKLNPEFVIRDVTPILSYLTKS